MSRVINNIVGDSGGDPKTAALAGGPNEPGEPEQSEQPEAEEPPEQAS